VLLIIRLKDHLIISDVVHKEPGCGFLGVQERGLEGLWVISLGDERLPAIHSFPQIWEGGPSVGTAAARKAAK
jgi:hypothetical protein